jgi:RimJ/RimL family protein N-acetyltransferase
MIKVISNSEVVEFKCQITDHLLSLTKEDLELRFFRSMNKWLIEEWIETCGASTTKHYFNLKFSSEGKIVSMGQLSHSNEIGEISFSVSPETRNMGLASFAVESLISLGKNLGLETVLLICKASNKGATSLLKKFDFDISFNSGDVYGSKSLTA